MRSIERNIFTVFIIIFILYFSFIGFFDRINSVIYDKTVSLNLSNSIDKKPVLLVEIIDRQTNYTKDQWNDILSKISTLKPKSYIFISKNNLDKEFVDSFSSTPIYLSSKLQLLHSKEKIYKVDESISEKSDTDKIGFIAPLESIDGVYRYNYYSYDTNIGQVLSLEQKVVQDFIGKASNKQEKYYINFHHNPTLPLISLDEFLSSASIEEIVKDKHIIFGYSKRDMEALLSIPINNIQISRSQFFTYSLLSLLSNNEIVYIRGYAEVLIVILFLLLGIFFHKVLKIPFTPLIAITSSISTYGVSWLLLDYFNIWLPVGELIFLIIIISYLNIWFKQKQSSEKTNKLLLSAAYKMKDRISHKTFFNSGEHWEYITKLITQTLNIDKVIFLEKLESEHKLQEIAANNCSFDDIQEFRRDYEREPYKTAIETKEVIKLNQREFFKNIPDDEEQFLAPLVYSGQVLGFWALTIKKTDLEELHNFNEIIAQYAFEISGLLYQRYEWRQKNESDRSSLLSKLTNSQDSFIITKIKGTFTILEKRLNMLETIINRYDNGVILYDMFGRVFYINKKMEKLLNNAELLAFKISAEKMIESLCDIPNKESVKIIRSIILDKYQFTYKIKTNIDEESSFLLKASALSKSDLGENFNDTFLFDNYGILIEIIDVSSFKDQIELKSEVIKNANTHIREILDSLNTTIKEIDTNTNINKKLNEEFNSFLFAYNKMEDIVSQDISFGLEHYYPINVHSYFERSIKTLTDLANESYIDFKIESSDNISLAFVNPVDFEETLNGFLSYLIHDAIENSTILINIEQSKENIKITLINQGFGLPNDRFEELLKSQNSDDIFLNNLRNSFYKIKKVNGDVISTSNHGEGIKFEIFLNRYQ